jgi:hypothetical protein
VLEGIMYSEVDSLKKMKIPLNFVNKITADVNETLDFYNIHLPSLISNIAAFCMFLSFSFFSFFSFPTV